MLFINIDIHIYGYFAYYNFIEYKSWHEKYYYFYFIIIIIITIAKAAKLHLKVESVLPSAFRDYI